MDKLINNKMREIPSYAIETYNNLIDSINKNSLLRIQYFFIFTHLISMTGGSKLGTSDWLKDKLKEDTKLSTEEIDELTKEFNLLLAYSSFRKEALSTFRLDADRPKYGRHGCFL